MTDQQKQLHFIQGHETFSCNKPDRAEKLKQGYLRSRVDYCGLPITEDHKIDTELVSNILDKLKRGKAVDIDGLSAEHLLFCHPSISVILAKLFQTMMLFSVIQLYSLDTVISFHFQNPMTALVNL